jgi:diguanylate cyclase (GGDEF)-like protein
MSPDAVRASRLADWGRRALTVWHRPFKRPRPTLVGRLTLLLLLGAVVIYLIGVGGLWWTSQRLVDEGVRKQALQWIAEMEELGPPVYGGKQKKGGMFIESRIKNFPEIAFVRYYDAAGTRVLREYGERAARIPMLTADQIDRLRRSARQERPYLYDRTVAVDESWFASTYARVIVPVQVRAIASDGLFNFDLADGRAEKTKIIGFIDLGINPQVHRAALTTNLVLGSLLTALLFLLVVVLGRRVIKRALTPLTDLQAPLARLAKGDINVTVARRGDAEIVGISDALNATVHALKQRDATLRRLAEHDSLTGLVNRRHFSQLLEGEIARVREERNSSALLFIDLDRFKYVNDILGHAGGDRLLVQVAELLKAHMRDGDVVARFGGDEFTVLVRNVTRAGAVAVAKLINDLMRDFYFADQQQTFNIYCSIGIAMIAPKCVSAEEALLQADTACYEAKSGGRNRYHLYQADHEEAHNTIKDISWSTLIKQALKEDRFELVYQPIVPIGGAEHEFYEVLLRLQDGQGVRISPTQFLSVAERFGLLAELDRWVIRHALAALAEYRREGRDVAFAINLSGQAFEDPTVVNLIEETVRLHDLAPQAVVFEITEQIAVRYMEKARRLMQRLTDIGCRLSLDDFGVGFSSFNYLKHFPVTYIKIDGSFVENMTREPTDEAMVRSIAQIAKALGKKVIAEFVQDDATIELLKQFKVDYVQGRHLGMPMSTIPHRRFARATADSLRKKGRVHGH